MNEQMKNKKKEEKEKQLQLQIRRDKLSSGWETCYSTTCATLKAIFKSWPLIVCIQQSCEQCREAPVPKDTLCLSETWAK